jgi:hypothetical protein
MFNIKRKAYNGPVDPFEPRPEEDHSEDFNFNPDRIQLMKYIERVDHPSHYNKGKFEVIDVIHDWGLDFSEGNVIKYVARSKLKDDRLEDLKKARWYLDYLIKSIEDDKKE